MKKFLHSQKGAVLVVVALGMAVFVGFAAFCVDLGFAYVTKSNLQKAADAAALAGAQMLPSATDAKTKALDYAGKNGVNVSGKSTITNGVQTAEAKVVTPYNGDSKKVEVVCTKTVNFMFAKVIGIPTGTIVAKAVAENDSQRDGYALPFLNLGYDYKANSPIVWSKQAPGDMGTIHSFKTCLDGSNNKYFEIKYDPGITIVQGYDNGLKGTDGSKLKDGVDAVLSTAVPGVTTFYVFSLSSDTIKLLQGGGSITVKDKNGHDVLRYLGTGGGFQQDDQIPKEYLVLIKCTLTSFDSNSNDHNIHLSYIPGEEYTLDNLPTGFTATKGYIRLVE